MKQQKIVKHATRCTVESLDLHSPAGLVLPH